MKKYFIKQLLRIFAAEISGRLDTFYGWEVVAHRNEIITKDVNQLAECVCRAINQFCDDDTIYVLTIVDDAESEYKYFKFASTRTAKKDTELITNGQQGAKP